MLCNKKPTKWWVFSLGRLFLEARLLDGGIEAGFLPRGGIFLDNPFCRSLVDRLLCLDIGFFHIGGVSGGNSGSGISERAFNDSFYDLVSECFSFGDAHVFFGIFLDRHSACSIIRLGIFVRWGFFHKTRK